MKKLCKCKQEKLIETLKDFNHMANSDLETVTECDSKGRIMPHTTREANDRDKLEFILEEWARASSVLYDLGIDLESEAE